MKTIQTIESVPPGQVCATEAGVTEQCNDHTYCSIWVLCLGSASRVTIEGEGVASRGTIGCREAQNLVDSIRKHKQTVST